MSRLSAPALSEELDRRAKIAALEDYLQALDGELGPISSGEQAAAREWADGALGREEQQGQAGDGQTA